MRKIRNGKSYIIYGAIILLTFCAGSSAGWFQDDYPAEITIAAFLAVLGAVTAEDLTEQKIPDRYHLMILALAGISCFTMPEVSLASRALGFLCVSVPLLAAALIVPGAFGGGDVKLMATCGAFLGWRMTLVSTVIAFFLGGIWCVVLLALKKIGRKGRIAFGPFLCVGMALRCLAERL